MAIPSSAMAANTMRLMANNAWVTIPDEVIPCAQGTGITG
jgi:hypothetical protein